MTLGLLSLLENDVILKQLLVFEELILRSIREEVSSRDNDGK